MIGLGGYKHLLYNAPIQKVLELEGWHHVSSRKQSVRQTNGLLCGI